MFNITGGFLKLLTILFIPLLSAFALSSPNGYQIVSKDSNRVEVKDLSSGCITPHLITNTEPSFPELTSEDQIRPWYYFDTVAVLPWYAVVVGADLNHSGKAEIYGWSAGVTYLDTLINEWNFAHIDFGRIGGPDYWGDTDGDSLLELLVDDDTTIALYESQQFYSYPSIKIWSQPEDCMCPLDAKIGDLDQDGLMEILYYYGQRAEGYQIYEYDGEGNYNWKTAIRFWDHVHDYTGEPSWGDIDEDGKIEVFAGGIHGEIIMYESVAPDSFIFVWQDSAGAPDAYSTEYLGDTDGDGLNEFMVAASSIWGNAEMAFSIYEATGDNAFELVSRFGISRYWASSGDIILGDFTGEGYREIALCTGYNITILRAFGDNDWRQIARYRNNQLDLETFNYRVNEHYNNYLFNVVRVPDAPWFSRILKISGSFLPGDVNNNDHVNGTDMIYLLKYIRGRVPSLEPPIGRSDLNGDCLINLEDITFMVNYFKGFGPAPEPGWCKEDLDQ